MPARTLARPRPRRRYAAGARDFEFQDDSIERFVTAADCERGNS
jgi:hypothetical protein